MASEPDDKIIQSRSPRFPAETLKDAIDRVEKLMTGLGRGAAPPEAVAKAIGFAGLSGASRTALASLSYYGLLRKLGALYKVSDLALRIIRPISGEDRLKALVEAHLSPKLFGEIHQEHPDASEPVLANLLLHKEFTADGAKRAAFVFKDNVEFLKNEGHVVDSLVEPFTGKKGPSSAILSQPPSIRPEPPVSPSVTQNELPVPIGDSMTARIPFPMTEDDFDLLIGTLNLWKKKLVRNASAHPPAASADDDVYAEERAQERRLDR